MAAIRSRKDRKTQNLEQPALMSSGSLYRSRALIQALSTATRESRFEGPAVPGSNHTTPTGPSSSLKSKLELLGPDAGDGEELMSEGQRQLQQLLRKQLDTSTSFKGMLKELQDKEFTPAVVFKPLSDEVKGLHSLDDYQNKEQEYARLDRLRQLGLTNEEIKLAEKDDDVATEEPGPAKRARLGADPKAQQDRLEALSQKLIEKEKILQEPIKYAGVKPMSRHAMEVERSLFRTTSSRNPLEHLTVEDRQHAVLYPKSVIPDHMTALSTEDSVISVDGTVQERAAALSSSSTMHMHIAPAPPRPLPVQVIERNRLSVPEIRALPRFKDYNPGVPNKVLFVKNLHHSVTEEDLQAVFGYFREETDDDQTQQQGQRWWPRVRVMKGRMKGQAFVEFKGVETASKALELVNGFVMKDNPLIICYGRITANDGT